MYNRIQAAVEAHGLLIHAAFHVDAEDQVPVLTSDQSGSWSDAPAGTLILIGNAGSAFWPVFSRSVEYLDGQPDALDRWSFRLGHSLAEQFSGRTVFPFGGPPYHPFLRWAKRGDAAMASPLGLSLHPRYGLWHAYRFGLLLPQRLEGLPAAPTPRASLDLCLRCEDKPCLSACPVTAFSGSDYQVGRCTDFLAKTPSYSCHKRGCAARRACPKGRAYQYQPEHAQFHMQAFVVQHSSDK